MLFRETSRMLEKKGWGIRHRKHYLKLTEIWLETKTKGHQLMWDSFSGSL